MSIIEELVGSYGYVAVAGIVGGESMGLPLPGESVLIAAGAYAGATHHLSVALVFLTAAVAAVVGDNVGFWVGRRFGPRLLAHAARRGGARQQHLQAVLRLYARHGYQVTAEYSTPRAARWGVSGFAAMRKEVGPPSGYTVPNTCL